MDLSQFDYELPEGLIAQEPAAKRDESRLLVVNRERETFDDLVFSQIERHLEAGDLLILNDTQVFPARLHGVKVPGGAAIEMLLTLQGRTHIVYTGVVVQWQDNSLRFTEAAEVRFRPLSPRFIEAYVHQHPPLDRAGAYGIQDAFGLRAISSIVGDYYTVVGLPVCRLLAELERHFQLPLP